MPNNTLLYQARALLRLTPMKERDIQCWSGTLQTCSVIGWSGPRDGQFHIQSPSLRINSEHLQESLERARVHCALVRWSERKILTSLLPITSHAGHAFWNIGGQHLRSPWLLFRSATEIFVMVLGSLRQFKAWAQEDIQIDRNLLLLGNQHFPWWLQVDVDDFGYKSSPYQTYCERREVQIMRLLSKSSTSSNASPSVCFFSTWHLICLVSCL